MYVILLQALGDPTSGYHDTLQVETATGRIVVGLYDDDGNSVVHMGDDAMVLTSGKWSLVGFTYDATTGELALFKDDIYGSGGQPVRLLSFKRQCMYSK